MFISVIWSFRIEIPARIKRNLVLINARNLHIFLLRTWHILIQNCWLTEEKQEIKMEKKSDMNLKTKLTVAEKILTLGGITFFGIICSILIGKGLIRQSILNVAILYLLTGIRPEMIFATIHCFKRDITWVWVTYVHT